MTESEFVAFYAERSGMTPAELAAHGRKPYRCACGEEGCEGWAMLPDELDDHSIYLATGGASGRTPE